jgi:hypothetical protein
MPSPQTPKLGWSTGIVSSGSATREGFNIAVELKISVLHGQPRCKPYRKLTQCAHTQRHTRGNIDVTLIASKPPARQAAWLELTSGATLRVAPLFRARIVGLNLIAGPAMGDCQVGS